MAEFKTTFAENIFRNKYAQGPTDTWAALSDRVVEDVCGEGTTEKLTPILTKEEREKLKKYINDKKFLPGGRYLYYAGRGLKFYNNCFMLKVEEDTREEWGEILKRASDCLMSGGGIGIDYSILRPKGTKLKRTGGTSSGPIPLMCSVNEIGRNVMQGGSRRSAIYASLNWKHNDVKDFIYIKDWPDIVKEQKQKDFNFPGTLDMTNISVNFDTEWLEGYNKTGDPGDIFKQVTLQMCKTGEPGFSFNFYEKENETLRNACTELTSEDDSDVCNLGSINLGAVDTIEEFTEIVRLATKFLVCGTLRADLPYDKVYSVREKNRRLGLGLMGFHEWLLKRGYKYEVNDELHKWLSVYKGESTHTAYSFCDQLNISRPKGIRAIAPNGTIGILACTTTGIEPLFAVAYKRRYLTNGTQWKYEYVIDATAQKIIDETGINPDEIETAYELAKDPERRIKFQYEVQKYVDHAISSTINLPPWGTEYNNEDTARKLAGTIAKYAHGLRGFTGYPDGARGGQPLTAVSYWEAREQVGVVFDESEEKCKGGICGI